MSPCDVIVVVIVDDDASFRGGLAANLGDDAHVVHEYADPRQVSEAHLAAARVLITDYHMADTDGVSFADGVHRARPELPIVLITAYWTVEVEAAVAARPFLQLCRKPVDYDDLHARIHQLTA
jgi:two-component system, NtrC family, nitrogen regulation response regulator GlnG